MTPTVFALAALLVAQAPEAIRLDVTRDTWLSDVGREADGSNGGSPRLKLKSHQEFTLVDIDPAPPALKGRAIRSATLHVRSTGAPYLKRVTVAALASPFREGTSTSYEAKPGDSTFLHRAFPKEPWTADGGDICNVMFGPRGALWATADASKPDADGWQAIPVSPRVLAARLAGLAGGFVVFDDTGTEWTREGDKFARQLFPNRFLYSREQNRASAPYFTVELGQKDAKPPGPPRDVKVEPESADLPPGETIVSWTAPEDEDLLGFRATIDDVPVPLDVLPLPRRPGERLRARLRHDRGPARFVLQAVDAAGNAASASPISLAAEERPARPDVLRRRPGVRIGFGPNELPKLGAATVAIADELDVIDPVRATVLGVADASAYFKDQSLFDAHARSLRLRAAKGEAVAFQVVLQGRAEGLSASLKFPGKSPAEVAIGRYEAVTTKDGPMHDPIVPLKGPIDIPAPGLKLASLHVELQVAKDAATGPHRGTLTLATKTDRLELPVELTVANFALPDHLSFLPEMNCYGLPDNARDFYRLAHRHRTVLNCVPYSHNGRVHEGYAPRINGKSFDWTAWDRRFGPMFDGSAFADLPRKGVPIELFYLPLFENWPAPIDPNYNGDYWADRAFTPAYRDAFVDASREIAEHVRSKKWDGTFFECFFNGKNDFKQNGWSRATSPWLLDEPANFQDFWALRYFGGLFHEGINRAKPGRARLVFRADISRPQWQRDLLADVLDVNIVGGAVRDYRAMVLERKQRLGQVVIEYGSTNPVGAANIQPVAWSLDAWSMGLDGVLPWQTVGNADSWKTADELALFYPANDGGPPVPSVRLKAYRRGQQDVEYLTILERLSKEPRWSLGRRVRSALKAPGVRRGTGANVAEDAGRIDYGNLSTAALDRMRAQIADAIGRLAPDPARPFREDPLIDLRTPTRHPRPLSDWVVGGEPRAEARRAGSE